ncbi:SseB family protein [Kitasatospora sp. NBC_00240]|uniref:SseB family protein n=1 Tax=Kitasatospora sp. NBC_00240 TaxID=2903567 RepID=UPI002B1DF780|nr:SseB family protein [Kitasatospora sp. NBC_00240]
MSAGASGGGDSSGGPSKDGPAGSAAPDDGPPRSLPGGGAPHNGALAARAAELGTAAYDPDALIGEFRRSAVLVPVTADGGWWAADSGGIRWLHAFTGEAALARFAEQRDGRAGREWSYVTVYGARLLDVAVPAAPVPTGVVLDVAGPTPAFLPPMAGIVPDAAALDLTEEDGRG